MPPTNPGLPFQLLALKRQPAQLFQLVSHLLTTLSLVSLPSPSSSPLLMASSSSTNAVSRVCLSSRTTVLHPCRPSSSARAHLISLVSLLVWQIRRKLGSSSFSPSGSCEVVSEGQDEDRSLPRSVGVLAGAHLDRHVRSRSADPLYALLYSDRRVSIGLSIHLMSVTSAQELTHSCLLACHTALARPQRRSVGQDQSYVIFSFFSSVPNNLALSADSAVPTLPIPSLPALAVVRTDLCVVDPHRLRPPHSVSPPFTSHSHRCRSPPCPNQLGPRQCSACSRSGSSPKNTSVQ